MSKNDITGDNIASRLGSKEAQKNFENNFNKIFGKKPKYKDEPSCLDAAYERKALEENFNFEPVFPENKLNEYPDNSKDM